MTGLKGGLARTKGRWWFGGMGARFLIELFGTTCCVQSRAKPKFRV
jgi:hypothetical protein